MACGSGLKAWAAPAQGMNGTEGGSAAPGGRRDGEESIILRDFVEI
jgi:hypothetical protein